MSETNSEMGTEKTKEACFCFLCFHFSYTTRQHEVKFKQHKQKQKQQTVVSSSCFKLPPLTSVFVLILLLFSPVFPTISAKKFNKMKLVHSRLKKINKPFLKSIQSPDGDIIDCVLTHRQPAFDHPKLRGKKPLDPPERPNSHDQAKNMSENYQLWSLSGESCPEGTIPIRRTSKHDILRANSIRRFGRKIRPIRRDTSSYGHEHAVGYVSGNKYYGAKASINVWAPRVANRYEFSLSQMWVISGSFGNDLNTIEAGWQVFSFNILNPSIYFKS
ncbi:protein neprosin-like [Bidens hawaiensis]|uniref:protein neprosin-like n=1 Tax=Bidens hawaiensis TaxID=980011 RepID=UPI00404A67E6